MKRSKPYAAMRTYTYDGMTIGAYTKSEARAYFKRALRAAGLPPVLPKGERVERG